MSRRPALPPPPEVRAGFHTGQFDDQLAIFDESYDRSLINIVPDEIRAAILRVKETDECVFYKTEQQLKTYCKPDPEVTRLKISFWDEYNRAQSKLCDMTISNVIRGNCSREYFYYSVLPDDKAMAWILCPPKDLTTIMREMLIEGFEIERDILTTPHKDSKGRVNIPLIAAKMKIIDSLKLRVMGAITQRIEQKSLQVTVGATPKDLSALPQSTSRNNDGDITLDELIYMEKRLERLKAQELEDGRREEITDASCTVIETEISDTEASNGDAERTGSTSEEN